MPTVAGKVTRRVMVTGVSGFVGGALGRHLRQLGYEVTGVSRTAARAGSADHYFRHDLVREVPRDWPGHEVIVHCAALAAPWASPAAYRANNVDATGNVLEYAKRTRARVVFISSSSVHYAHGDQLDIREDSALPMVAINEYAASKRRAEELVRGGGLQWVILRPRAVFGPGDTVLFPRILRAAATGSLPRIVRADGKSPMADLIYIDNLTHYVERALALGMGGTFNLTNNEPVELSSFLDGVLEQLGLPKPRRRVKVGTAMLFARAAELASQYLFQYREPPVTRFGVEVMAYSKTFNVAKMLEAFGPPPVSIASGVQRFVEGQLSGQA